MPDDKVEAENIWKKYYGDPNGLAEHLINICLSKLGVVYHVFAILDTNSDYDVSCRFYNKINGATLQKLLETNESIAFCKVIYAYIEAGPGGFSFTRSCLTSPGEMMLFKALIKGAKVKPNETAQPRKLSDAAIAAYKKRAKRSERFNEEIIWELPQSGTGFVVYNRNDVAIDGLLLNRNKRNRRSRNQNRSRVEYSSFRSKTANRRSFSSGRSQYFRT